MFTRFGSWGRGIITKPNKALSRIPQPPIGHFFIDETQESAITISYHKSKTVYHECTTSAESQQHTREFLELHRLITESLVNPESRWTSADQLLGRKV